MWLRDARGRWHRSGQGLRRGILLGLRETAKSIAAGPELACGSDSRPCRDNAVSRSPSSNHPLLRSSPARCHLPLADDSNRQEKTCRGGMEADWASCPEMSDWYRYSYKYRRIQDQIGTAYHHKYRSRDQIGTAYHISTEESQNQIGTTFHFEYRSIQTKVNNVAHTTTKNYFRAQEGGGAGGRAFGLRNSEMAFPCIFPH